MPAHSSRIKSEDDTALIGLINDESAPQIQDLTTRTRSKELDVDQGGAGLFLYCTLNHIHTVYTLQYVSKVHNVVFKSEDKDLHQLKHK